ncbi:MAG: SRPBCC family protein [Antricoccus sp.]
MKLEHSFTIPVTVDEAWPILLDIKRIAPCMPGAAVDTVDGDDFSGTVKVKLGPISLTYKGQAKFVEKNDSTHTAVIDARGRDSRGNGTASAKITASLEGKGESTDVNVVTDLNITGKPAQFGRGVMVDVGNKIIGQFADCLAQKLGSDEEDSPASDAKPAAAPIPASNGDDKAAAAGKHALRESESTKSAAAEPAAKPKAAAKPAAEPEPIDLLELAGGSVAKRAIPVVGALLAILGLIFFLKKRK